MKKIYVTQPENENTKMRYCEIVFIDAEFIGYLLVLNFREVR
jgi:hypothetical protein